MSMGVHNNLAMMNASRQFKINTGNKAKSTEKLSSGFRINRAADDAAGLQISEKMREQIRGLNRGTKNAQDGVSWVQTGDGAMEEVHELLQRMRELTIQSLNDTNTPADRAACQAEFDALQCEIDRITGTTQFNTQNIFDEHESPYYQCEGNVGWQQSQPHAITAGKNDLVIGYRTAAADASKIATITVPAGIYTTQELMDEVDDAIIAQGLDKEGIVLEYTKNGTCNLNLEGGEIIDSIGGGLSYLFYEIYEGGSFGALIGTTVFSTEKVKLEISGQNNHLEFDIEDFNGNITNVSITVPDGKYTRSEMIDYLNAQLTSTDVTATAYGTGIKLEGADSIVTGFKGNMFKIDDTGKVYHSVFYDNVKYGSISMTKAYFEGGLVKPTTDDQEEHQKYVIGSSNNQLIFQANGADAPVTLTIPEDSYTVGEMVAKLNDLFLQNNLELSASIHPNYSSDYQGIRIDSTVKGNHSFVGLDDSSSAYNTLFVVREYNKYNETAKVDKETAEDRTATLTGAKEFTGTNVPLTITAGVNDQFTMNVDGTAYTITLTATTYNSAADIANEIEAKLTDANAPIGYKDKIHATVTGSQVLLEAKTGSGIKNITVAKSGTNTGYEDIFVKTTITKDYTNKTGTGSSTTKPSVTLGEKVTDPMVFDSSNNTFEVTFNGNKYPVTIPTGTLTRDEVLAAIKNQLPTQSETISDIKFDDVEGEGDSSTKTVSISGNGRTTSTTKSYDETGDSNTSEGNVGVFEDNKPATVTIQKALPSSIEITDSCNQLQLSIDGTTHLLQLTNNTYTPASLVTEIQNKINAAFPKGGRATVSLDTNGQLVFKADLVDEDGAAKDGKDTNIKCGTATSTFLKKLFTTEEAASGTSNNDLLSDITIGPDSNTFNFSYKENGVSKTANLTLDSGTGTKTYTRSQLVAEINKQLQTGGHNVIAELSGNKLKLSTKDLGNDTSISYSSTNGGTSVEALFGTLLTETAATGTANKDIQNEITIDDDSNQFNVVVNNNAYSLTLDKRDAPYTRTEFVDMLNDVFERNNVGLTAELKNNKITYTTIEKGDDASFEVTYDGGGSAMKAIYGESRMIIPGIDVSFTPEGYLTLTGTQNGGSISVKPTDNSAFLKPVENVQTKDPEPVEGFSSTKKAYIDGVDISEPITIDRYNNELKFTYHANGNATSVSITVPDGDYGYSGGTGYTSIVDYLQAQLDSAVGSNQLVVSATNAGIRIEAVNPGSKYYMSGFSGDFYKKVLCSCVDAAKTENTKVSNGTQTNDLAYTVGRKDIRNVTTNIRTGINDTLSLDLTYNGTVYDLSFTLDAGSYSGAALVKEIQEKLDKKLVAAGMEAGTIEAGIGGVNTGVSGSNDNNALVFRLSSKVRLPGDGQYIIDGVSGNAAFSVFYQTEGGLDPAYVKGGKDISQGVTIYPGETELSFKVDSTEYSIQLTEGEHTTQEILDEINAQLLTVNAPLVAEMEDNVLKLSYNKIGRHSITDVNGLAKDELFYSENGDTAPHQDVMIQLSSNTGNAFTIERPIINTAFLKVNSIAITQPKYANKALVRLDDAIARVSEVRSTFGSEQNRLEHAVANNQNTQENTQTAESRIRDTNMAEEVVANARNTILEQAAMAMQAQAKQITEGVLRLLQ